MDTKTLKKSDTDYRFAKVIGEVIEKKKLIFLLLKSNFNKYFSF